jgi:tetratricopeptide (TPR) repeat protein
MLALKPLMIFSSIFPGNYYIGHGGKTSPWPIDDEGRNLSLYKENNFGTSKSYHVSGTYTNWFGGYWNNENFGFGHWAPYSDAPGKKIWIWSLARDGAIWEDLLTDTDGQYIEVQSGVKFNQASRSSGFKSPFNQLSIRPYYTDTKTEFWFPVVGTRGIVDASPYGTLNVSNSNGSIIISLSPITDINDSLYVTINGNSIYKELLRLKPLQLYEKTIPLSGNEETGVAVVVGKDMLSYYADGEVKKINKPNSSIENPEYDTAEHMFRLGEEVNAMREYKLALEYYLLALQKEPTHSRALSKAAELYYRKADFSEGLNLARKVLRNNAYDAAANYIYGLIKRSMGSLMEAEEAFSVAARTLEYRSGAYLQIAGIKLQMHHYRSAIEYTKKALDYNRLNIQAYEFMAISYRKFDKQHEAAKILDEILEIDPLNHFARFELYLQNPTTENLNNFNSFIRNELPHETYIELALEYYNQGQIDEAIKVLEQSPDYPTVSYWLSYLYRDSSQGKSSQYLKKAVEMSAYLVFPYRLETIPVLDWAMHQNESWKTKYYLGLIYWHILSTENAMELFEQCGDIPDYAPFYLARGILFKDKVMENCFPCSDFKHAVKMNPEEWRTWHFLNTFLQSKGDFEAQLENSKQAYSRFPANPVIGIDYVKAMINSGDFRESIKLLSKVNILPQEGAREGHNIYELANLSIAVGLLKKEKYKETLKYLNNSKKWPENLGAGKPYDPDTRLQDYISAYCYSLLGKTKLSDTYYNKIANNYNVHVSVNDSPQNIYILAKTLQAQGKYKEAEKLIINLKTKQTSVNGEKIMEEDYSPELQWIIASFYNKHGELAKLETKLQINKAINWNSVFISAIKVIDDNFK